MNLKKLYLLKTNVFWAESKSNLVFKALEMTGLIEEKAKDQVSNISFILSAYIRKSSSKAIIYLLLGK